MRFRGYGAIGDARPTSATPPRSDVILIGVKKHQLPSTTSPAPTQPWAIHFFQRHEADDPSKSVPGREFLAACPKKVLGKFLAALKAVADAPPPQFSGGGKWKAMHGSMGGYYEVIVNGP